MLTGVSPTVGACTFAIAAPGDLATVGRAEEGGFSFGSGPLVGAVFCGACVCGDGTLVS